MIYDVKIQLVEVCPGEGSHVKIHAGTLVPFLDLKCSEMLFFGVVRQLCNFLCCAKFLRFFCGWEKSELFFKSFHFSMYTNNLESFKDEKKPYIAESHKSSKPFFWVRIFGHSILLGLRFESFRCLGI